MERDADPRKDLLSAAVLLLLAGAYLGYNVRHPLDTLANPGPGIFPLAVGLLLLILATLQLVRAGGSLLEKSRATESNSPPATPVEASPHPPADPAPLLMMGFLVVYLMTVSWIGFLTSTFFLVIACGKLMGSQGWGRPMALAAGIVLCCYLLFIVWLKVPLPAGRLM